MRILSRSILVLAAAVAAVAGPVQLPAAAAAADDETDVADQADAAIDADLAPIAAILDQLAEAYGGRDALSEFPGCRARGKVLSLSDGVSGTVRMDLSLEGDLRTEIKYPHRNETRILSGRMAWSGGPNRQRLAGKDMAASMLLQYHRLVAPFELAATDPADLEADGHSEEGWVRLRREWGREARTFYEIDPETGFVRRVRGEIGEGSDVIRFETESNDFRKVDGIIFPFRMTTTVGGHAGAEIILDRVVREDRFDPQRFVPSGSAGDM